MRWLRAEIALVSTVLFCAFAWAMLFGLHQLHGRLREANDARVIADSHRRAGLIADFIDERRRAASALAEQPEIAHFLASRALGMSMKYGLGVNLDAIEDVFRKHRLRTVLRERPVYEQIVFRDADGSVLVALDGPSGAMPEIDPAQQGAVVEFDVQGGRILSTGPVWHKDAFAGAVFAVTSLALLERFLTPATTGSHFRELVVDGRGVEIPLGNRRSGFSSEEVARLGAMPRDRLAPITADGPRAAGTRENALRTGIAGTALSLVTVFDEESIHGRVDTVAALRAAALLPLALLVGVLYHRRARQRAAMLQQRIAEADRHSSDLRARNTTLAREIETREAVERELRAKSAELERMASSLRDSKAEAEEASRAKSRFLANMSHEIRTPLNGILGMAQLLAMPGHDPAETASQAGTILRSGQVLLALLNDILDLSKIESGRMELHPAPLDCGALLALVAEIFREPAGLAGLELHSAWEGPSGTAYVADALRLQQVLSNLASNAIKFTPAGSIAIQGHEAARSGTHADLEFRVRDTGIGIPTDKQAMLFQPFTQVDDSGTRRFGGTGLGLSIVRNLVELMGGTVSLHSTQGIGTLITVRVRVALNDSPATAAPTQTRTRTRTRTDLARDPADIRILLVEDIATNLLVAEGFARRIGVRHASASNGREAVDRLASGEAFDLVLMDCEMPVMDGFDATRAIRAYEATSNAPRLPIIALTADAYPEHRLKCREAGMDDFLAKPLRFEEVRETIAKWCHAR